MMLWVSAVGIRLASALVLGSEPRMPPEDESLEPSEPLLESRFQNHDFFTQQRHLFFPDRLFEPTYLCLRFTHPILELGQLLAGSIVSSQQIQRVRWRLGELGWRKLQNRPGFD